MGRVSGEELSRAAVKVQVSPVKVRSDLLMFFQSCHQFRVRVGFRKKGE